MIKKLDNGSTHITLGKGTCYHGVAYYESEGKTYPYGICFKNQKEGSSETDVIIEIANHHGVASYMMAMVSYLELSSVARGEEVSELLKNMKQELSKIMPEDNTNQ